MRENGELGKEFVYDFQDVVFTTCFRVADGILIPMSLHLFIEFLNADDLGSVNICASFESEA